MQTIHIRVPINLTSRQSLTNLFYEIKHFSFTAKLMHAFAPSCWTPNNSNIKLFLLICVLFTCPGTPC